MKENKSLIEAAFQDRSLLKNDIYVQAIHSVIASLDEGTLRVAEKTPESWVVHEWVKQAILLYFGIQKMKTWDLPPFEFYDKMDLKKNFESIGDRKSVV